MNDVELHGDDMLQYLMQHFSEFLIEHRFFPKGEIETSDGEIKQHFERGKTKADVKFGFNDDDLFVGSIRVVRGEKNKGLSKVEVESTEPNEVLKIMIDNLSGKIGITVDEDVDYARMIYNATGRMI